MQTRGKSTLVLRHGGGAVREIDKGRIVALAGRAGLPCNDSLAGRLYEYLRDRLISVDAPPFALRDDPKAIVRIEKAADKLLGAIRDARDWGDISLSLQDAFAEKGWPYDDDSLVRALLVLKDARKHLFESHSPADGYHGLIQSLHGAILDAGGNVAVHDSSQFVEFLVAVEAETPGLIFPPGTVESGRTDWVRRALGKKS